MIRCLRRSGRLLEEIKKNIRKDQKRHCIHIVKMMPILTRGIFDYFSEKFEVILLSSNILLLHSHSFSPVTVSYFSVEFHSVRLYAVNLRYLSLIILYRLWNRFTKRIFVSYGVCITPQTCLFWFASISICWIDLLRIFLRSYFVRLE